MVKKRQEEEKTKAGDIRVLMTALNLILLVFFVYINSIGENDEERVKKALDSLAGTFSILPGGLALTPGRELSEPGIPIMKRPPVSKALFAQMKKIKVQLGVRDALEKSDLEGTLQLSLNGKDLIIHLSDMILFGSGTAEFHSNSLVSLEKIGSLVKNIGVFVRVEGHTDDQPISTDRYRSNWELSAARALSIIRYLVAERGISPHRLSAVGYGEFQPLVPNDSKKHRATNRRVSIVFLGVGPI